MTAVPKIVVFDLDMCVWSPEMYELDSAPRSYDKKTNTVKAGRDTVKVFPGALAALQELNTDPRFADTIVACASTTSHTDYAMQCLQMFEVAPGRKFADVIILKEIYYHSSKTKHFRRLKADCGLDWHEYLFFDDCNWGNNCADVERGCPGVVTMKTPHGLTVEKWQQGLDKFAKAAAVRSGTH